MSSSPESLPSPETAAARQRLIGVREALLRFHQLLLASERRAYERQTRPIRSNTEFLQLALRDPAFSWLRPVSELIVQLDEALGGTVDLSVTDMRALFTEVRKLTALNEGRDEFVERYREALQRDPEVVLAHREVVRRVTSALDATGRPH